MNTVEFVSRLHDSGVRLYLEDGRFKCSAPLGVLTPELRSSIQERKSEILSLLGEAGVGAINTPPIVDAGRSGPAPLSLAQGRLWFLEQLLGESATYNIPVALRLTGTLKPQILVRTLQMLVQRHGALRTTFSEIEGKPMQTVHDDFVLDVSISDCEEAGLPACFDGFARRPFDLSSEPAVRAELLRLSPASWVLMLNVHHIVCDGWSIGLLTREIGAVYAALASGADSPLNAPAVQFVDYAWWEQEWIAGGGVRSQLEYWRTQLMGLPDVLTLPHSHARPPTQRHRGDRVPLRLSLDLADKLRRLARGERATLYMVLLAAYALVLARHSGQPTVAIGTPVANRTREELEGIVGFFVNTLVMKVGTGGDPTFLALLASVRETALKAFANQSVPFDALVEDLNPTRSLSHTPLFQAELVLQNLPPASFAVADLRIEAMEEWAGVSKFDISLSLFESPDGLDGRLEYDADLFDRTAVEGIAARIERLLHSIAANPSSRVSQLAMLSDAELHKVLVTWNDTSPPGELGLVHECFERQAKATPDVVALEVGEHSITYRSLNARANQYAHELLARGVGAESLVGVCLERSPDLFAVILGILKAAGAYVPLDPAYPEERLQKMATAADIKVLVTQRSLTVSAAGPAVQRLYVDDPPDTLSARAQTNPQRAIAPASLTYVMFTSGSTGVPKGVALPHRTLVNLMQWYAKSFPLAVGERTLQFASASFDVSFEEFATTWNTGGTLVVASEEDRLDPAALLRLLGERAITRTILPVVVLQSLAREFAEEGARTLPPLRQLLTSGAQLQYSSEIQQLLRALPGCELHNNYGPAETHAVLRHAMRGDPGSWPALPPIGSPIDGATFYILDSAGALVPPGVQGELFIGGVAVGRGYLNRPDLTAERFLPDPFGVVPGGCLYKTGDLVRASEDGCVEWLGRCDALVKIRGCRVELGEIEVALGEHPLVREVVVSARPGADGSPRLVAYFCAGDVSNADLRAFLSRKLPDYMLPSAFHRIASIPLNANGKVDLGALAALEVHQESDHHHAAPRTETEARLAVIWADVLCLERVGVDDDFFACGGHSLMATQVISRVRRTFQIEVPVRLIFEAPTVALMAERLDILGLAVAVFAQEPASVLDDDEEWVVKRHDATEGGGDK